MGWRREWQRSRAFQHVQRPCGWKEYGAFKELKGQNDDAEDQGVGVEEWNDASGLWRGQAT